LRDQSPMRPVVACGKFGLFRGLSRARNSNEGVASFPAMDAVSKMLMKPRNRVTAKTKASDVLVPDKLYFRIGEVSRLCHLPAYVLRFWETEFPQLKPVKSSTGQRMYRRKDVENVLHIKQLLYEQGFTIAGARQHLRAEVKADKSQAPLPFPPPSAANIKHIRQGLNEILTMLSARR
jgi:DNA-binding transcriptional MerR regulator